jgi:hypothetical protein
MPMVSYSQPNCSGRVGWGAPGISTSGPGPSWTGPGGPPAPRGLCATPARPPASGCQPAAPPASLPAWQPAQPRRQPPASHQAARPGLPARAVAAGGLAPGRLSSHWRGRLAACSPGWRGGTRCTSRTGLTPGPTKSPCPRAQPAAVSGMQGAVRRRPVRVVAGSPTDATAAHLARRPCCRAALQSRRHQPTPPPPSGAGRWGHGPWAGQKRKDSSAAGEQPTMLPAAVQPRSPRRCRGVWPALFTWISWLVAAR